MPALHVRIKICPASHEHGLRARVGLHAQGFGEGFRLQIAEGWKPKHERARRPCRRLPPMEWGREWVQATGCRGSFSDPPVPPPRSEERRVGKECRSRWS